MKYILGKGLAAHSITIPTGPRVVKGTFNINNLKIKSRIGKSVKDTNLKQSSSIVFTSVKSLEDVIHKLETLKVLMQIQTELVKVLK